MDDLEDNFPLRLDGEDKCAVRAGLSLGARGAVKNDRLGNRFSPDTPDRAFNLQGQGGPAEYEYEKKGYSYAFFHEDIIKIYPPVVNLSP